MSRAFYDADTGSHLRRPQLPRRRRATWRASPPKTGEIERLVDIKGPLIYTVTSLVWNPSDRQLYYTTDNGAHRDLVRLDPATGRTKLLQKDARIGDLAYNAADRSLWGIRHLNGLATLVRIKAPYTDWERVITWPYGTVMYDLDVSADGTRVAASFGEISGKQDVRVFDIAALRKGDTDAARRGSTSAPPCPTASSSRPTAAISTAARTTPACRTSSATTSTPRSSRPSATPRPASSGRCRSPTAALLVFRYTGEGSCRRWIDPTPLEDVSPITFLGERLVEEQPGPENLDARLAGEDPVRHDGEDAPARIAWAAGSRRESIYPDRPGLQRHRRRLACALNLSDPLMLNRLQHHRRLVADHVAADGASGCICQPTTNATTGAPRASFNDADFYDLFGPTKVGRKGYSALVGHRNALVFDEPRRLELDLSGRDRPATSTGCPTIRTCRSTSTTLFTLDATLSYTDVRNSLGDVDDETGSKW